MRLFALGLNHHTAPLDIREQVAFRPDLLDEALHDFTRAGEAREAAILSTCNRTELYFSSANPQRAVNWLADYHRLPVGEIIPYLYSLPSREAVRHVFRVASGLDSMVVGEPQILGQVKEAVRRASDAGTLGVLLNKLFQNTFKVAKEVRSTTAIGASTVSMAAAALQLSGRIFDSLADQRVLLIGAGEMVDLCAAHFAAARPRHLAVANRTEARAKTLADRFNAEAMSLNVIGDRLANFDTVISCTASPLPILGLGMVERAVRQRRHRPMVMVDLAVPRDIEPEVAQLDDVFLYTVDNLAQIVNDGKESRQQAVEDAEQIINARVDVFLHWVRARQAVPTIRSLRQHAEDVREAELQKAVRMLSRGEAPQLVLEQLSQGLANKLTHAPMRFLNQSEGAEQLAASRLVQQLFNLDVDD